MAQPLMVDGTAATIEAAPSIHKNSLRSIGAPQQKRFGEFHTGDCSTCGLQFEFWLVLNNRLLRRELSRRHGRGRHGDFAHYVPVEPLSRGGMGHLFLAKLETRPSPM